MTSTTCSLINNKQKHVFSMFLKNIRQHKKLSQEQLCLHLRKHSSLFYNLDTITISRWERGVNIPSLAKQQEIIEIYDMDLSSIYSRDEQFLKECNSLIAIPDISDAKSIHPYYRNDDYYVETIDTSHDSFYLILNMILRYEGNPSINNSRLFTESDRLKGLKINIASTIGGQIIGHCLYLQTTVQDILEFVNVKVDLHELMKQGISKSPDALLVLSSAGATIEVENSIMSTYINLFAEKKHLRHLCFSTCHEGFIKKINAAKLNLFKIKSVQVKDKHVAIHSFLLCRSEVMANRFLLKLSVITPEKLINFLDVSGKGALL